MSIKNITKSFDKKIVLNDFSLDIPIGSSVLIEGPSGSGKTTLLRCISLLESIDSGSIYFEGKEISNNKFKASYPQIRNKIGMIFQQLYLWGNMKVIDNIVLPLKLNGISKKEAQERAMDILLKLDIADKANQYPSNLSGGQQQRAAIARAITHKPKLLLLDEIASNLDQENAENVFSYIEILQKAGIAVVIVSHNSNLIPASLKKNIVKLKIQ